MSELPSQTNPDAEVFNQAPLPPHVQRIYDTVDDYQRTIRTAYNQDIMELDAEADAWIEAGDIAAEAEQNPDVPLTDPQKDLLAAMEAHAGTFKATSSFTAEQNSALDALDEMSAAGILLELADERRKYMYATTSDDERVALRKEELELRAYADMLDSDEAKLDVADVSGAVDAYKDGGKDAGLKDRSHMDTKANAYFAKYIPEVVAKVQPKTEQDEGLLSEDELAAAKEQFRRMNMNTGAPERTARTESPDSRRAPQSAEDTPSTAESARNIEIFDKIVSFGKNRTHINVDVDGGFGSVGDGPKANEKIQFLPEHVLKQAKQNPDWRQHLNEAVMFSDVTEPDSKSVTGNRAVTIRNETTGQDEPVVRFRYQFRYSEQARNSGELPKYSEFNGHRGGQQVLVGLDLPKSMARKLQEQIESGPASVRSLVESLVLQNNNGTVSEEKWRKGGKSGNPIRPPWGELPDDWNIGMITGEESTDWRGVLNHQVQQLPVGR